MCIRDRAFYGYEQVTEEEIAVAAAIPIGENTFKLKTVSYTHLDVYKRQP